MKRLHPPRQACAKRQATAGFEDPPIFEARIEPISIIPIGSMYGTFTYIYIENQPNVGEYTIHGSYGIWNVSHVMSGFWLLICCFSYLTFSGSQKKTSGNCILKRISGRMVFQLIPSARCQWCQTKNGGNLSPVSAAKMVAINSLGRLTPPLEDSQQMVAIWTSTLYLLKGGVQ